MIIDPETTVAIRATIAKTLIAAGLTASLALGATPALAQHVVTDYEAGKLTLDALTATPIPVVHHVIYRTSQYQPGRYQAGRYQTVRAVQSASFRHSVRASTMSHLGSSHHRRRS